MISNSFRRRFFKYGPGKTIFDNRYYHFLRMTKNYVISQILLFRSGNTFKNVKVFCVFIGHMKSGGSMLSALLDAHRNAVFADEVNALEYLKFGFNKNLLFQILVRNSKAEAQKGRVTARRLGGYSWDVADQWQGKYERIDVVGDCKTGATTRTLSLETETLPKLYSTMTGTQVKFIHVIRNPFDPIAASMVRGKRSFENASEKYFSDCDLLVHLHERIEPDSLLLVRYGDFVKNPREGLATVCDFLGLTVNDDYLNACAGIIHSSDESRNMINWEPEWITNVENRISTFDFLRGYTYENL